MRNIPRGSKAVVLLSGGIDSATTLYLAKKHGYALRALIFDYNQRHKKEVRCAVGLAQRSKVPYRIAVIEIPWANSALTQKKVGVWRNRNLAKREVPRTYVSGRNIIFLGFAASFAESIGAKSIFIGAHTQDYSGYPDCRPRFLMAMERAVNLGVWHKGISIAYPLINKTKKEIIALAHDLGVPFEYTWSCYAGRTYPCGKCDSCRFRHKAFKELGLTDPLVSKGRIQCREK